MLQDVEAGRPLEIDCLTAAVVELADQLGIAVPHTRTLHACVKLLEARVCAPAEAPAPVVAAMPAAA
jgi:2-dehydropantoate 2-reductase